MGQSWLSKVRNTIKILASLASSFMTPPEVIARSCTLAPLAVYPPFRPKSEPPFVVDERRVDIPPLPPRPSWMRLAAPLASQPTKIFFHDSFDWHTRKTQFRPGILRHQDED